MYAPFDLEVTWLARRPDLPSTCFSGAHVWAFQLQAKDTLTLVFADIDSNSDGRISLQEQIKADAGELSRNSLHANLMYLH